MPWIIRAPSKPLSNRSRPNPHSAAAHFELGWLYDEKAANPAAAIYHYREYLQLDPQADNAQVIQQRIYRCKQQLAADVLPLPSTPAAQQQLEKLLEQNRQLQAQVDHLNDVVKQWNVYYTSQLAAMAARTNPAPAPNNPPPQPQPRAEPSVAVAAVPDQPAANPVHPAKSPPLTLRPRTHTVEPGETAMAIVRKYGLKKLSDLETANPKMDPGRIRAGQVLNIPPP